MTTLTENIVCVYDAGSLIAIIKRDEKTGHKLVYMTKEASVDELAAIIEPITPDA